MIGGRPSHPIYGDVSTFTALTPITTPRHKRYHCSPARNGRKQQCSWPTQVCDQSDDVAHAQPKEKPVDEEPSLKWSERLSGVSRTTPKPSQKQENQRKASSDQEIAEQNQYLQLSFTDRRFTRSLLQSGVRQLTGRRSQLLTVSVVDRCVCVFPILWQYAAFSGRDGASIDDLYRSPIDREGRGVSG